ncbi:MAG: flavin reductase [Oscillospiraceae bacterium]|nr:flavin reductase family protein [Oscillospiraceae bacterium]MBQ8732040.1 flavin reductase [Oscillospiraceae bacterium]
MEQFRQILPEELGDNPFSLIGKDWLLLTAGAPEDHNTMTVSWAGMGVLWNKNVCTAYVRPQRHTFGFMEREEYFTLSAYPEEYREALRVCGTKSGREINKAAETGLTPFDAGGATAFEEARLVLLCRKLYAQDLRPECIVDPAVDTHYPQKDYHRMYIGEILRVLVK